jgi:drug/metabolite transporter (DMT)-like permease
MLKVSSEQTERLDVTNWIALIILALGAVLVILNESGVIAGLDTATFGYVAMFSALIVYLSGGMVGSYKGRRKVLVRDMLIWFALGVGILIFYIFAQRRGFSF